MLLTLMMNLSMYGPPGPSPVSQSGDGVRNREDEKKKKLLKDDAEVENILKIWMKCQN
jgi:hypothetical protein